MSEQVYPNVFVLSSLQETRAWVKANIDEGELVVRRPFVMVGVSVQVSDKLTLTGIGFAKCATSDVWNEDVGIALARFRAERDAAQQVYKHTLGGKMDGIKQSLSAWAKEAEQAIIRFAESLKPLMDEWEKHDPR